MRCPKCESQKTRVVDSREGLEGRSVRRRRICEGCQYRFTTFERLEDSLPMVIKKGGQRESFDRYKVLSGLKRACEKRPVSVLQMEDLVRDVEMKLLDTGDKEVSSGCIGELVIERLRELDQVAYVRFASVYREFSDVSEFIDALRVLMTNSSRLSADAMRKQLYAVAAVEDDADVTEVDQLYVDEPYLDDEEADPEFPPDAV